MVEANKFLVCVIHDKKYNMRLQTLNNLINKLVSGFKVNIIDSYNHDCLTQDDIRSNIVLENPKSNTYFDGLVKSMHVKQVSQLLKHKCALQTFTSQDVFDTMLVIEDDVLCSENIHDELEKALKILQENQDIDLLMLGCPTPRAMSDKGQQLAKVLDYFKLLPTSDAYLIRKQSALKLLAQFSPAHFQLNTHLSYLAYQSKINLYMLAPNVFVNGSKYGVYVSSLDPNNKLFMNADYNTLVMLNAKPSYSQQEYDEVVNMAKSISLREHPDFQVCFGNFFMRIGKYDIAKEFYDNAYKTYVNNDCILNNESEFMMNYTRVFKYLQTDRDLVNKELDANE